MGKCYYILKAKSDFYYQHIIFLHFTIECFTKYPIILLTNAHILQLTLASVRQRQPIWACIIVLYFSVLVLNSL